MNKTEQKLIDKLQKKLNDLLIEIEQAKYNDDTDYLNALLAEYQRVQVRIEEHVSAFFARYANKDNKLDDLIIYYMLTAKEKRILKYSLEDIIERGVDENTSKYFDEILKRDNLTRIEGLKAQVKGEISNLYQTITEGIKEQLGDDYLNMYNGVNYGFFKSLGLEEDPGLSKLTEAMIKDTVSKGYTNDEQTLSDVLSYYQNQYTNNQLKNLNVTDNHSSLIERISKETGIDYRRMLRVLRTGSAYVATKAQQEAYSEWGVENVLFMATLDNRTSEMCREMDGTIIPLSEVVPGDNAPPLHYNCRSVLVPYYGEETIQNMNRIARDPITNKSVFLDSYMTYPEWYEKFGKYFE